jgi:hypothetical protein
MERIEAERIAAAELAKLANEIGVPVSLCPDQTVEKRQGWAFFYNSKDFIETGNFSSALMGNGPIVVKKADGAVECYGSLPSVEKILASLE